LREITKNNLLNACLDFCCCFSLLFSVTNKHRHKEALLNMILTLGYFILQVRLVDGEGIINPKAFYNYLSAWASNDALAYGASQANLHPEPRPWYHAAEDFELKIPKSAPLIYTQLPFYLHGLGDTQHITRLIAQVQETNSLVNKSLKEHFFQQTSVNFAFISENELAMDSMTRAQFLAEEGVILKNGVFWDVTLCGSCKNRRFEGKRASVLTLLIHRFLSP
jgi:hypothetical protein